MKLKITKDLSKSTYSSKFELTELTTFDEELLEDCAGTTYLDIKSDVIKTETVEKDDGSGGTITEEVETVLLKQPHLMKAFAECIPLELAWSINQYGEKTEEIAIWATKNLEDRIIKLVDELKLKGDSYSGISERILTP